YRIAGPRGDVETVREGVDRPHVADRPGAGIIDAEETVHADRILGAGAVDGRILDDSAAGASAARSHQVLAVSADDEIDVVDCRMDAVRSIEDVAAVRRQVHAGDPRIRAADPQQVVPG